MAAQKIFSVVSGVLSTTDAGTATVDIAVPTNTVIGFFGKVVLHEANNTYGGQIIKAGNIYNNAGTVTMGGTQTTISNVLTIPIATATAVFSASSTNLRLTVTGVSAIGVIDWLYEIQLIYN